MQSNTLQPGPINDRISPGALGQCKQDQKKRKKRLSCRLPAPAHLSMAFAYGFGTFESGSPSIGTPTTDILALPRIVPHMLVGIAICQHDKYQKTAVELSSGRTERQVGMGKSVGRLVGWWGGGFQRRQAGIK